MRDNVRKLPADVTLPKSHSVLDVSKFWSFADVTAMQ